MNHRGSPPSDVTLIKDENGPIPHIEPFVVKQAPDKPRKKRPKKEAIVDVVIDPNPVDWGTW